MKNAARDTLEPSITAFQIDGAPCIKSFQLVESLRIVEDGKSWHRALFLNARFPARLFIRSFDSFRLERYVPSGEQFRLTAAPEERGRRRKIRVCRAPPRISR